MEHGGVSKAVRLEQIREMRKGRVDLKGKPLPGYAEIARLESEIAEGAE
jgi:regulator of PEP synthase PpsR (kinase-PPPase family)